MDCAQRSEVCPLWAAANQRIKALRAMFSWANEAEETTVNPTLGVKKLKYASSGHHTWTVDEIEQFNLRHAERYTKAVNRQKTADTAMAKLR